MGDPNLKNANQEWNITSREFDLFVKQMHDEHEENLKKFDSLTESVEKLNEKFDDALDKKDEKNDKDHRLFLIWLVAISVVIGGTAAGMEIITRLL